MSSDLTSALEVSHIMRYTNGHILYYLLYYHSQLTPFCNSVQYLHCWRFVAAEKRKLELAEKFRKLEESGKLKQFIAKKKKKNLKT